MNKMTSPRYSLRRRVLEIISFSNENAPCMNNIREEDSSDGEYLMKSKNVKKKKKTVKNGEDDMVDKTIYRGVRRRPWGKLVEIRNPKEMRDYVSHILDNVSESVSEISDIRISEISDTDSDTKIYYPIFRISEFPDIRFCSNV
ncbi:hypothetical protein LXL04_021317 [Taraxacum kok-saghyz]